MDTGSLRDILFAGMHPARREILAHLASRGRARFTQLAELSGYDPVVQCGSFNYHLSRLEEMGMVGREKEAYVPTAKGRKANELIAEAISPKEAGGKSMREEAVGAVGEEEMIESKEVGEEIVVRQFLASDIPLWMKAAEKSKMFRRILAPQTEEDKQVLEGIAADWRQEAENLVHGAKTRIRPVYAELLTTSERRPDVEGEERFSFGAFSKESIVGLIVGVIARQRSMGRLPLPGTEAGRGKRKKIPRSSPGIHLHMVGHVTGIWTDRRYEKSRRELVRKLLETVVKHLASKKVEGLQFTLYDDFYLDDLKSLGFLSLSVFHGVYLPPELSKVDVEEGWGLPRSPYLHPVLDAPLGMGLVGKTPARVTSSKTWYNYPEFQLIGGIW